MPMSGCPLVWDLPMRWGAPAERPPACRSGAADCPAAWIASRAVAQVAQACAGEPDVVEGDGRSSIAKRRIIRHVVPSEDA